MRSRLTPPLLIVFAGACESAPVEPEIGGDSVEVQVLDEFFVRYNDRRVPVEEFIYQVRLRCRAVEWDPAEVPQVRILTPTVDSVGPAEHARLEGLMPRFLDRLQRELRAAGVRMIDLGEAG